jgi:hypothetical protein
MVSRLREWVYKNFLRSVLLDFVYLSENFGIENQPRNGWWCDPFARYFESAPLAPDVSQ